MIEIGTKFANLTVLEEAGKNNRSERLWMTLCDCGNNKIVKSINLVNGKVKSCGCLKTGPKIKDFVGLKFCKLTVKSYSHQDKWRTSWWTCLCDCGNSCVVSKTRLTNKTTQSCGCIKTEYAKSISGEKNPNYNASLQTADREKGRLIFGYKEWLFSVKKRDDFKCQVCLTPKSGTLVSHHLNSYDIYVEQRLSIDNGVCLCEACHLRFHKIYGYGKNTKEQFLEFKNEQFSGKSI